MPAREGSYSCSSPSIGSPFLRLVPRVPSMRARSGWFKTLSVPCGLVLSCALAPLLEAMAGAATFVVDYEDCGLENARGGACTH